MNYKFKIRIISRMKKIFLGFFLIGLFSEIAVPKEFVDLIKIYEKSMQRSAHQWIEKNYAKALDGLYRTSDYLSKHMPPPEQRYNWSGCIALKTYTIVIARLVEEDMYLLQNQEKMVSLTRMQAKKWADLLDVQSKAWNNVNTSTVPEDSLRKIWINRFNTVIKQTRN